MRPTYPRPAARLLTPGPAIALVAVLAVAVLAACAGGGGDRTGDHPPSGPGAAPPAMPDASVPATPELTPVTAVPGSRVRPLGFTQAGQSTDGRVLFLDVAIGGAPCDAVTGVDVAELPDTVTVTVYAGAVAGATCDPHPRAVLGTARIEVRLAEPLGSRTLRNGA